MRVLVDLVSTTREQQTSIELAAAAAAAGHTGSGFSVRGIGINLARVLRRAADEGVRAPFERVRQGRRVLSVWRWLGDEGGQGSL